MPVDSADVVVIGGGVSGLSSAYFLARAGKNVVVVEKGTVGGEASGRSGGMISERVDETPMIPLGVESVRLWETLDDELGYPTEFTQQGRLQVAGSEEEMGDLFRERDQALRHGVNVDLLDPSEIRDMIPGISERTLGGMFSPNAGHANPQRTVQAFAWAFQGLGGQALPEHRRHGHRGRQREGLLGGDDRRAPSRPTWWSPLPDPRPR